MSSCLLLLLISDQCYEELKEGLAYVLVLVHRRIGHAPSHCQGLVFRLFYSVREDGVSCCSGRMAGLALSNVSSRGDR